MLLVAHRIPATRAACEQLAAAGAQVFEADVQVDGRGRVVVSHYLSFGVLQRDNWRLRLRNRAADDPLLVDVSARVPESCRLLLDLKQPGDRLTRALRDVLPDRDRYIACGGSPADLDAMRSAGFRTWRTLGGVGDLRAVLAGDPLPDDAVSVRQTLLSREVVAALHERVPEVIAWTVNRAARARQLMAFGVDGITTDRLTRASLVERTRGDRQGSRE